MSLSNNFPVNSANLNQSFANARRVDPRVTFTRATTATFFNQLGVLTSANNDVPRIDFNPSTLVCNGLLIEEQRTNLCLQSQTFQTTWSATRTIISVDAAVAPDSTLTGDKFIATSVAGSHLISQTISVTAQAYTLTCFAKASEYNFIQLNIPDPGAGGAGKVGSFNLSTGTLGVVQDAGVTRTITSVGNGWYRCSITFTVTGAGSSAVGFFVTNTDVRAESFTGNDVNGIFIWGAQLEAGAFPTSYIPTTTTALTRNADAASMTGTDFSSWYNQTEGTFVVNFAIPNATDSRSQLTAGDGTANERIIITNSSSLAGTAFRVVDGGSDQCDISRSQSFANNATVKVAGAYKVNDFAISQNGGSVGTDTSGTLPTVTTLFIGTNGVAQYSNSYISRIAYYPVRNADSQLQALTG
jgi:hypothetical protein